MSLVEEVGAGTNTAVTGMKKFFINQERILNFGSSAHLKLFESIDTGTGRNELLDLADDWTARYVEDPKLNINRWEIEIIDRESTTKAIMNKAAIIAIGSTLEFKSPKRDNLEAAFGIWRFFSEGI